MAQRCAAAEARHIQQLKPSVQSILLKRNNCGHRKTLNVLEVEWGSGDIKVQKRIEEQTSRQRERKGNWEDMAAELRQRTAWSHRFQS